MDVFNKFCSFKTAFWRPSSILVLSRTGIRGDFMCFSGLFLEWILKKSACYEFIAPYSVLSGLIHFRSTPLATNPHCKTCTALNSINQVSSPSGKSLMWMRKRIEASLEVLPTKQVPEETVPSRTTLWIRSVKKHLRVLPLITYHSIKLV